MYARIVWKLNIIHNQTTQLYVPSLQQALRDACERERLCAGIRPISMPSEIDIETSTDRRKSESRVL